MGNAILNADGTFHIDTTSSAAGRGVFVWHNSDYSALAYSDSPNGAKTYIRDTTGADQMLMHDQIGQTILDPACIGSYYLQVTRETPSLIVTTQQDIVNPYDGLISLREAIAYATADVPTGTLKDTNGNFTITFDSTIFVTANSTIHLDTTLFVYDYLFNITTDRKSDV